MILHELLCERRQDTTPYGARARTCREIAEYLADRGVRVSAETVRGWYGGRPIPPATAWMLARWRETLRRKSPLVRDEKAL